MASFFQKVIDPLQVLGINHDDKDALSAQEAALRATAKPEDLQWTGSYEGAPYLQGLYNNIAPRDKQGMDKFRTEALRDAGTQSPWAQAMQQRQALSDLTAKEQASQFSNGQIAGARSGLAMRGGIGSGASVYLQRQGMRDAMNARQDIGRQGSLNNLSTGIQDESNRESNLKALPGMETAWQAPDIAQANTLYGARQKDNEDKLAFLSNQYNQKMQAYAGAQSGANDLRAAAAGKSKLFGLA